MNIYFLIIQIITPNIIQQETFNKPNKIIIIIIIIISP